MGGGWFADYGLLTTRHLLSINLKKILVKIIFPGVLLLGAVFSTPVFAQEQEEDFFIDLGYDSASRPEARGLLLFATEHAYVYVERDWWQTLNATAEQAARKRISEVLNEFNTKTYPQMVLNYGSEWNPGIDGDPRLTILFTVMKEGVAGYFNSADQETRDRIANSNEREMLYLSTRFLHDSRLRSFLAHEFQHLITYYQKNKKQGLSEETWLNEARSEYAPTLLGFDDFWQGSNLAQRVGDFLENPTDSLTEWQNEFADYGAANIFMQYLVDRFGRNILRLITQNDQTGIASVNGALSALGSNETFSDVFTDWSVAVFLNNCSVEPAFSYCFRNNNLPYERLHISLDLAQAGEAIAQQSSTKDWAAEWLQVDYAQANKVLQVDFTSTDSRANFRVPYVLVKQNGEKEARELLIIKRPGKESATFYLDGFGEEIVSAIFIPHNEGKTSEFSGSEPAVAYNLNFSLIDEVPGNEPEPEPEPVERVPDGSLIRRTGDFKVWVVNGNYRRWIQSPVIMDMYGHFQWQAVQEVSEAVFDSYEEAWLIRAADDFRVFEINGDGTKHWLNISAEQFSSSGRKWEMVFVINSQERDWYRTGADVRK